MRTFFFFLIWPLPGLLLPTLSYAQSPADGEAVEVYTLEWPADELLCDAYDGSEGPLQYEMFRLKKSGQIVKVREFGAYCQGDSEYGYSYHFDEAGNVSYSVTGGNIYTSTYIRFYTGGRPVTEAEYAPELESAYMRTIRNLSETESLRLDSFIAYRDSLRMRMRKRIQSLQTLLPSLDDTGKQAEATKTIQELESGLAEAVYKEGYTWRKPRYPHEELKVKGTDIRVRSGPGSQWPVQAKVSQFELYMKCLEVRGMETIEPYGTYPWYKIRYYNKGLQEGWIFGAFVQSGVYPEPGVGSQE